MQINKNVIGGLLGGGVTIALSSFGGFKLNDKITYDRNVKYYGGLNGYFSKNAPTYITNEFYIPKWEDDERWKKAFKREKGRIAEKGFFKSYQEMRDACYELINKDREFKTCSDTDSWCTSCTLGKTWNLDNI